MRIKCSRCCQQKTKNTLPPVFHNVFRTGPFSLTKTGLAGKHGVRHALHETLRSTGLRNQNAVSCGNFSFVAREQTVPLNLHSCKNVLVRSAFFFFFFQGTFLKRTPVQSSCSVIVSMRYANCKLQIVAVRQRARTVAPV